jgi:hypothetical protein
MLLRNCRPSFEIAIIFFSGCTDVTFSQPNFQKERVVGELQADEIPEEWAATKRAW